jgi:hypothetical protein
MRYNYRMKKSSKNSPNENTLVIYRTKDGALKLKEDATNETLWASLDQIAQIFGRDKSVISRHFKKIFLEGELLQSATVAKNATVQIEGKREVMREIEYYNLDAIISVGYRVNSKTATHFRQWATKTLKQHIVSGYTINPERIGKNYQAFMEAVSKVSAVLPKSDVVSGNDVLELVRLFADTWFSLDAYDKETLSPKKMSKKKVSLTAKELRDGLDILKQELYKKGEATENFAQARTQQSLEGIVGNVMQSFGGTALYPSIESKAAHLLYFIIKNHPFVDGNKRSGAYAFVWFLRKAKVLDTDKLSPTALTALTLLIAESAPTEKEKVVGLVTMLVSQR